MTLFAEAAASLFRSKLILRGFHILVIQADVVERERSLSQEFTTKRSIRSF